MNATARFNQTQSRWPQATKERPCPNCGKHPRCLISPDGGACKCWREGGKLIQLNKNGNGHHTGTGYIGKAHLKPAATRAGKSKVFTAADEAIAAAGAMLTGFVLVDVYGYSDSFMVTRFEDSNREKSFRPVHQDKAGWKIGDPPGKLPLYRLNDLPATGRVFICEGEKAADAARMIGLAATTSAHGSSGASKSNWQPIANREIVILPDADEPGEHYAADVIAEIFSINSNAKIRVVRLPDLPPGGDIVEFIDARDSLDNEDIAGQIQAMADIAFDEENHSIRRAVIVNAEDVVCTPVQWLWRDKFPLAKCSVAAGIGGVGKSFFTTNLGSMVSQGATLPDGTQCKQGITIFISGEDDPATIAMRCKAQGADLTKIKILTAVKRFDPETKKTVELCFTLADVAVLQQAIEDIERSGEAVALIIIDPIGSYIGGQTDANTDNAVRAVLGPLAMLAEKCGAAVLMVAHHRKTIGINADDLILGSRAFSAFARCTWHIFADIADPEKRLMLPGKNNLAARSMGLAFKIGGNPPAIDWLGEVDQTANQFLAELAKPGPEPEAQREAAEFLKEELSEGPVESGELKRRASEAGHTWRTVERAKQMAKVIVQRNRLNKKWEWRLPKPGTTGNVRNYA